MPNTENKKFETIDTKREFSLLDRGRSFVNAGRGLMVFWKTTPNAWIQTAIMLLALVLAWHFGVEKSEWLALILASGLVLAAEAFNTAIEIDINLTSPGYHPYAKDTKDVAAGAVLIASLIAAVVGLVIFIPYIF